MNEQGLQGLIKQYVLEAGKLVGLTPTDKSVFLTELAHLGASGKVAKKASAMARELGMCRQNYWRAQKRLAKAGLDWSTLLQGIQAVLSHDYTSTDDGHLDGQNVISHDYKNRTPLPGSGQSVISHDYKTGDDGRSGGNVISHDYKRTPEGGNVVSHDYKQGELLPDEPQSVISHDYKLGTPTPSDGQSVISHDYKNAPKGGNVISHDYKTGEEGEMYSPESTDEPEEGENVISHDYKRGEAGGMGTNIYYIYNNNNILDNKNKSRESLRACGCACACEGLSTPPDVISTEPTIRMPSVDAGDSRRIAPPLDVITPSSEDSTEKASETTPSDDDKPSTLITPSTTSPSEGIPTGFIPPPSEERVMAECKRQGIPEEEARKFYLFNEQCGWRDGRGRAILNWRAALGLWILRGVERLAKGRGGSGSALMPGAGAGSSSATLEMRVGIDVD